MKKQPRQIILLWLFIAALVAGGTFLICEHFGLGVAHGVPYEAAAAEPDTDVQTDVNMQNDISASTTHTPAVSMQKISDNGYTASVPASWSVEYTASDTIALHPDATSPDAACKIEVSSFPFATGKDVADWIGHRIGADPSLSVSERSSEDVSVNGGTGVKWIGVIDDLPTTLVYLFNKDHAYEIAPSVIGEDASGDTQCNGMLATFLSGITI